MANLMASLLIALVVAALGVQGTPISSCGPEHCTSAVDVSDECLDFCVEDFWKRDEKESRDNDTVCEVCTSIMETARKVLLKGEGGFEVVVSEVCAIIPFAEVQEECFLFTGMELRRVRKFLESELKAQTICSLIKLCDNSYVDNLLTIYQNNDEGCQKCIRISEESKHLVNKMGIQEFATRAIQTCRELGSYTDACATVIFENVEPVFTAVPLVLGDGTACLQQRICKLPRNEKGERIREPPAFQALALAGEKGQGEVCDFCEELVQGWRDWLLTNRTEDEFKDLLEKVCSETGILDQQCKDLVDAYYTVVFEWINHNLKPGKVCTTIGLCKRGLESAEADVVVDSWPMILFGEPQTPLTKVPAILFGEPQTPLTKVPAAKLTAAEPVEPAHLPLPESEPMLGKEERQSYGKDMLDHPPPRGFDEDWDTLVEMLPPGVIQEEKKEEQELVHIPAHVEGIVPSIHPHGTSGGPSSKDPMAVVVGSLLTVEHQDEGNGDKCAICQNVLHFLQTELMNHQTEDEIKELVEDICEKMPSGVRQSCDNFVQEYGDMVITLIAQNIDPSKVCPLLHLCPGAVEATVSVVQPISEVEVKETRVGGDDCVLCVYAMEELIRILEDQKTEDEIREVLDKVCSLIPGPKLGARCRGFIDNYLQEIVDTLLMGMTPREICTYVKLCQPKDSPLEFPIGGLPLKKMPVIESPVLPPSAKDGFPQMPHEATNQVEFASSAVCLVCEFVMKEVEDQLAAKPTREEIEDVLRGICSRLPTAITADCQGFVNEYFNMLVEFLETMPPSEVCTSLKLCKGGVGQSMSRCEVCEMGVDYLDRALQDTEVESSITELFEKACKWLPPAYQKQCVGVLSKDGPYVLYLISVEARKDFVCEAIKQCPRNKKKRLEKARQTWSVCQQGPEVICHNKKTAKLCQKEDFCRRNFWEPNRQVYIVD